MSPMLSHESYYTDPTAKYVETKVLEKKGDDFLLEHSLLYPGGGGQDPDRGTVGGLQVTELDKRPDGVWHRVPGLTAKQGDAVRVEVDWPRRYDLMRGHTGEHLLFGCLKNVRPELENRKVSIKQGCYSIFIDGPLQILDIEKALVIANNAIITGAVVTRQVLAVGEAKGREGLRAKWDLISSNEISVVTIQGVDSCACGGVHVGNASELGALAAVRVVKSTEADWQLDFVFGREAVELLAADHRLVLEVKEGMVVPRETILPAVLNLSAENQRLREGMNLLTRAVLDRLEPEAVADRMFYSYQFIGASQKELNRWAAARTQEGSCAVLLGNLNKNLALVLAGPGLDCAGLLKDVMDRFRGKGGGKPGFFQGGLPADAPWDEIVSEVKKKLEG